MRSFISAVALLVKVTARVCSNSFRPLRNKSRMYSTVNVNVFPAPAEALYIDNVLLIQRETQLILCKDKVFI